MAVASPRLGRAGPGGFIPPSLSLPSPASSNSSSRIGSLLPHPRSRPLVPGSKKEDYARDYIYRRLLHVSRRYVKKFGIPDPADEVSGYNTFDEVCTDLDDIIDVLWFSGTPSIQVPYLLNVAHVVNEYLGSFTPLPRPTFALLQKLDYCFASLLVGRDIKTREALPGFTSSSSGDDRFVPRFTKTDMVRCKSIADETRMLVAIVMSGDISVVNHKEGHNDVHLGAKRSRARSRAAEVDPEEDPAKRFIRRVGSISIEECDDDKTMEGAFNPDFGFDSDSDSDSDARFENVVVTPPNPLKRKSSDIEEDFAEGTDKRVKVEEDLVADVDWSGVMPAVIPPPPLLPATHSPATSGSSSSTQSQQFRWTLDDDDSDSDSEDESDHGRPRPLALRRDLDDSDVKDALDVDPESIQFNGEDEPDDDCGSEDEEDEEMQLNVAKVYVKTLIQLDLSLGTSIVND